jgi:hypothetical protein
MTLDLTELDRLEALLQKAGIPYERTDELSEGRRIGDAPLGNILPYEHHQIWYPSAAERLSDAIISTGSYGHEEGLLEQMDLLGDGSLDRVEGWMTADTVFSRWAAHEKEAKNDDDQSVPAVRE